MFAGRPSQTSDVIRYNVWRAISPAQKLIGFFVADNLLRHRIKSQNAPEAIGCIGQVHQRRGDVTFFYRAVDVLDITAADTLCKICKMVTGSSRRGAGLNL